MVFVVERSFILASDVSLLSKQCIEDETLTTRSMHASGPLDDRVCPLDSVEPTKAGNQRTHGHRRSIQVAIEALRLRLIRQRPVPCAGKV